MTDTTTIPLENLTLRKGAHNSPEAGMCVMEAVAYYAGEPFSDRPKCVDRVVGAYARSLNDRLPNEQRQHLKVYLENLDQLVGTSTDGKTDRRTWMAADRHLRHVIPARFDVAELSEYAAQLRALPEVVSIDQVRAASAIVREAKTFAQNRLRDIAGEAGEAWEAGAAWAAGDAWEAGAAWAAGDAWEAGAAWAAGDAWEAGAAWAAGDAWEAGAAGDAWDAWEAGDAWAAWAALGKRPTRAQIRAHVEATLDNVAPQWNVEAIEFLAALVKGE